MPTILGTYVDTVCINITLKSCFIDHLYNETAVSIVETVEGNKVNITLSASLMQ